MIKFLNKKSAVALFIFLILFSIAPKTTFALVPTFELNPVLVGAETTTAAATTGNLTKRIFEWVYNLATEVLKKKLLDMMVDQIIVWIQGGGKPKFITDWKAFLGDAVDQAGGEALQQVGLSYLCSAFKPLLSAAFIPIPTFTERTACTLSKVGVNLKDFLNNFKNGGWIAWNEMVLRPQNNVYGAYLMAWDEYEIRKSAAAKAAESEAQAGKGFLSVKRCAASHQKKYPDIVDEDGTVIIKGDIETICDKEEIVTPGVIAGDMASKALGANIDWLVNAQDLKAYVAAIANAVLNRVFAEGLKYANSALVKKEPTPPPEGTVSAAQTQCVQLLGTPAYNDCIASAQTGAGMQDFEKNYLISLINKDLVYQNQLLGAKQATLTVLSQSADILSQLKNCQASTSASFLQTQKTLAQVQGAASTTASQIPQIQSDIIARQIKQQEITAIADETQIPPIWAQVTSFVDPVATQSLALAAQDETEQAQQNMNLYQQQLTSCQAAP